MQIPEGEIPIDPEEIMRLRRAAAARLPAELRFVLELPNLAGLEAEEMLEFSQGFLKKLRTHREQLLAHGYDADRMITKTGLLIKKLGGANAEVEQLEERVLQATADSADARFEMFKKLEAALQAALEENPFDPKTQALKEQVEEWRQHMPREEGGAT